MLPKVSAALARFVAPVSSSSAKEEFQRYEPEQTLKSETGKILKVVPEDEQAAEEHQAKKDEPVLPLDELEASQEAAPESAAPATSQAASMTRALLQLLDVLRTQKMPVLRWLGMTVYKDTVRNRKSGKIKKGSMLDRKAG